MSINSVQRNMALFLKFFAEPQGGSYKEFRAERRLLTIDTYIFGIRCLRLN